MIEYPWMAIAREKLGIHEIPGPKANAFIVECLKSTTIGRPDNQSDDGLVLGLCQPGYAVGRV